MGKAIISNRIYLTKTPELQAKCMSELKYVIPPKRPTARPEILLDMVVISNSVISIPVAKTDLIPADYTIIDKRVEVPVSFPEPSTALREDQKEILDLVTDNCLINAKPGWGKTFTALYIAKKLGQKTLVVTHNTTLRDQWITEVNKLFGIKAGKIGTGVYNADPDIVIANVQTLTKVMNTYNKDFGLLIVDECHKVPASTFKNIVDSSYARYKIGLSATIQRKDKKHIIIPDYFSTEIHKPKFDAAFKPSVLTIYSPIELNNRINHWVAKVSDLSKNPAYIELVLDLVRVQVAQGHQVLCLADRLEFLDKLHECTPNSALVTSYVKMNEREEIHQRVWNREVDVLFGTTSIYKEGISINTLSCLILTTPINNAPLLEQLIGRITRHHEGKIQPVLVDIALKDRVSRKQYAERLHYYLQKGYKLQEVSLFD